MPRTRTGWPTYACAWSSDPCSVDYARRVSRLGLHFVRYGIAAALFVAGIVLFATGGRLGLAVGAMLISAATAVLLLNVLYRIGVEGDKDRDREEEARRFFDEHGRWPS